MRAVHKRYLREFIPAMAAYVVLIGVTSNLVSHVESRAWRALLVVLPMLPVALVIRALVRVIRDQDELERQIDLEAISISSALTGFGFFTFGLLAGADVVTGVSGSVVAIWVMPALFASFGLVKGLIVLRYRRQ
ncbi:hypothetical protein ACPPVV_17405 [Rhodanobacter sp. Col0626]|uniref:hypothetical protein n=1 Tax=Rhodanobacter sp. Col0626 TaxID=3415679 RepID=UPI003CF2EEA7